MNIYLALTLFSLMILLYWVISELFAMLFRFTGLPDEKARFQVFVYKRLLCHASKSSCTHCRFGFIENP